MTRKDLRIATWNANGLLGKKEELEVFLTGQDIDICLISETHMTNQSYLKISKYRAYHTPHPDNQASGGSAIIIKNSISHAVGVHLQKEEIQLTTVTIDSKIHNITIGAVYCPPKYNLKKQDYDNLLLHLNERFIVGGDFNAKHIDWGSRITKTKGRELKKSILELNCNHHSTGNPTYWPTDPNKLPDLLDFFISRKVCQNFIHTEDNYDLNSDHSAVILTLSDKIIKKENKYTLTNHTTDWVSFKTELEKNINLTVELKSKHQLDIETENLISLIQKAAWNNTREVKFRTVGNNYPVEIRNMVREKRKARKKWQQTRHPADKTVLNNLTQQLKREIQKIKQESIKQYLENMTADEKTDYSLWKATKKIKRPTTHVPPIKNEDGSWAVSNRDKAEVFALHLENTFKPNEGTTDFPTNGFARQTTVDKIPWVTPKEVTCEIKNLNSKKSPGYDLITGEIMKQLPKKGIIMLTYLINTSFRLKYVPKALKVSEIIMLPKPGKPANSVKSYRPISILPIISKILEKLFLKRLQKIIEKKNIIPSHQFGCRQKHSTVEQLHRITDVIENALENKKICSAIFLDVAQAFDKVCHKSLSYKLYCLLPEDYAEFSSSYIDGRLFRVKHENEYSELKEIDAGVPQGSVIGPVLYLIYTCDVPVIEDENVTVGTYVDDTTFLAVGEDLKEVTEKLQRTTALFCEWTDTWGIKLNEQKSIHINFTNRKVHHIPIKINGNSVPYANTAKYLGMTLDCKLRWKEHIQTKRMELNLKYNKLNWLLGRKSQLSIPNKIKIYNQILKPVWLYGIQLWACAKNKNIEIIQVFQNKVLRGIVNAPWYFRNSDLHRDLGVPKVADEIKKYALRHKQRLQQHINQEVKDLLNVHNLPRRLKRKRPLQLVSE